MAVITQPTESPQITITTSTVFEVMASARSVYLGTSAEQPPYLQDSTLHEHLDFFYSHFDYGAQLAELAIDYPTHDSFEGFLEYIHNLPPTKFLYYLLGRYLSVDEVESLHTQLGAYDIEQLRRRLEQQGGHLTEELQQITADPLRYREQLVQLWRAHWEWIGPHLTTAASLWERAMAQVQKDLETTDWEIVVEHLLKGRRLPPQFPPGTILRRLTLIPSVHMSLKYFIIWGLGAATVVFDAQPQLLDSDGPLVMATPSLTGILKRTSALSEHTRLAILALIHQDPNLRAVDLAHTLNVTQATVSRHLAILKDAGLIREQRRDLGVTFALAEEGVQSLSSDLLRWIHSTGRGASW
ncbi:helix-turn-helix transcriptional regulator [Sulfobacillus sp. hq2]|uniref:ArsR/SmtB family transcription factor n=1 Tax=Sulfobacillus TaxID=28033 RepID=UPI000CD04245|nr:metalloregulator ArsR/SmtB family transcription factor [Sulfobacillus sp. hq2]POB11395.1 hypothetical protein CO251_04425 [Sulfobacillus sp. hq2]